ncbi:MAG: CPBP family intramembrane metalloprotease [Actinobacteria bacterium]|nr:CPBP family intramembrane metalloprotease [Actinomycetota bacterium]
MTLPNQPPTPPQPQPPITPTFADPSATPTGAAARPSVRWGLGDVFIGLALWLAGGIVGAIVLVATGTESDSSLTELSVGALTISVICGWIGFLGWPIIASYWKGQRSLRLDFGLEIRPIDLGWGVLGGLAALVISGAGGVAWSILSNEAAPTNTEFLPTEPSLLTALAIFVLVAVCTPIVEELFFRGLFLRAVGRRWNLPIAVIITSLVFGMFHAQGNSLAQAVFIVGVTASYGAVFAVLVIRANGRLGPSIVAHMCVNAVGVLGALYL